MLLIISEQQEDSTDNTIEWILSMGKSFVRINTEMPWRLARIEQSAQGVDCWWSINGGYINMQAFDSVWFRRGLLQNSFWEIPLSNAYASVKYHLTIEGKTLKRFVNEMLARKKSINHPKCYNMNKLVALRNAVEAGMFVPPTLVTQNPAELEAFRQQMGKVISKPIQDCMVVNDNTISQICMVENEKERGAFAYSLFQQEIQKKTELRVFYLNGKCYAVSISPKNERSIDGRALERADEKIKRIVPYRLPEAEEEKIRTFMKLSELNCGSLDIILGTNNQYVFLEVNPVGQFDYVSKYGNYYIERDIARFLVNSE